VAVRGRDASRSAAAVAGSAASRARHGQTAAPARCSVTPRTERQSTPAPSAFVVVVVNRAVTGRDRIPPVVVVITVVLRLRLVDEGRRWYTGISAHTGHAVLGGGE